MEPSAQEYKTSIARVVDAGDLLLSVLSAWVEHFLLETSICCILWALLAASLTVLLFFFGFLFAHSSNFHVFFCLFVSFKILF